MMKNGKKLTRVKDRKSSAYPGLEENAPHKAPRRVTGIVEEGLTSLLT